MRIDSFLNAVNLVKRRAIAQDMIAHNAVFIGDKPVKASREVKVGDKILLQFLTKSASYLVLEIPASRTVPKGSQDRFVKELI
ncbi:hypothetical protein AGMMS50229_14070 [Campylobacterota bacterium]|nr:hypothetical protein AGMMS50229_14070 [Campylobacterota bacterium]